jgi:hypothetical protein
MSDFPIIGTPAPQPVEDGKSRSGAGARRVRQVQARLDQCIKEGQAPPYCQNCGAIETPTWRRAWSKKIDGTEEDANACLQDPFNLFWEVVEKDDDGKVAKFKVFKKTLVDTDKDFLQILLCNRKWFPIYEIVNLALLTSTQLVASGFKSSKACALKTSGINYLQRTSVSGLHEIGMALYLAVAGQLREAAARRLQLCLRARLLLKPTFPRQLEMMDLLLVLTRRTITKTAFENRQPNVCVRAALSLEGQPTQLRAVGMSMMRWKLSDGLFNLVPHAISILGLYN